MKQEYIIPSRKAISFHIFKTKLIEAKHFFDQQLKSPILPCGFIIGNMNTGAYRGVSLERFDSLYESFQDLTSVQVSHFVEYFSGSALDSEIWNESGTGSSTMKDEIDGGYELTTGASLDNERRITFNGKRHYSETASEVIAVTKRGGTDSWVAVGMADANDIVNANHSASVLNDTNRTNYAIYSTAGGTGSITDGSNAIDTNWHTHKLELGASNIKSYFDGVLDVTKSTDLPANRLCPIFEVHTRTTSAKTGSIRYYECYNTSISINSSLYERWSALTQVLKQRVVEYFVGSGLDTDRWNQNNRSGTGTFAMIDAIDEGYSVSCNTASGSSSALDFNDKRQFDNSNSIMVAIYRRVSASTTISKVGLLGSSTYGSLTTGALFSDQTNQTFKLVITSDGTTSSNTATSIGIDTSWHSYKLELGASNVKAYIDGVLEVTKSTNLPNAKLMPHFASENIGGGVGETRIRYLEAYNKLGTETDYPSYYELFNPLTTLAKTHFVEWFDGAALNTRRWTENTIAGTHTFAINDAIDGGFRLTTTSSTNNDRGSITFNDKRQFDHQNSILVGVMKSSNSNNVARMGYCSNSQVNISGEVSVCIIDAVTPLTNIGLETKTTTSTSTTQSSVARHGNATSVKIELGASDNKLYLDGVLEVTKSTDLPAGKMQPIIQNQINASGTNQWTESRYLEAKNT